MASPTEAVGDGDTAAIISGAAEALGRIDPAVPTRDATGVPAAGVPSGVGRAIDVVGLDPCDVDARDGNGRRLDADCAREASGEWTRLACISIFGSQ